MVKSRKNLHRSNSVTNSTVSRLRQKAVGATFFGAIAFFFFANAAHAAAPAKSPKAVKAAASKSDARLETYRDIIQKAQNLTLQRDRLQTSQVLIRAIGHEARGGAAYRELTKALEDLTSVFYTEKAQAVFVTGESLTEAKPKEAIDQFQEALRLEDGNVAVLKALARTQLTLGDCAHADVNAKSAEAIHPFSSEVKLIRLQSLECSKSWEPLGARLAAADPDLEPVEKFLYGLRVKEALHRGDTKKARSLLTAWEALVPDYPEVFYWKWELARQTDSTDRASALKYSQLCQNLTLRKRKSYILDVDLCKGKEAVDVYLKESGFKPSAPVEDSSSD